MPLRHLTRIPQGGLLFPSQGKVPGSHSYPLASLYLQQSSLALDTHFHLLLCRLDRGRSTERGVDLSREHEHRRHNHTHDQTPTHHHHHSHHRHTHRHHHGRHSNHQSLQSNNYPNVTIHAHGQTISVPRPSYQHTAEHGVAVSIPPRKHPVHSPNYLSHPSAPAFSNTSPVPPMRMPVPPTPPREAQTYGPTSKKKNYFQYSQCTGRKKALCIGINYIGQPNELNGCINDARGIRDFLIKRYNFLEGDIVLLTDDGKTQRERPTKKNIMDAMHWLVQGAHPHDSLVFHYSGHGGQTEDLDGDESDGYDEVIFPVDWKKRGHILDDDMHTIMVKSLPAGCRLTCCHSGSSLDLPYMYGTGGKLKKEPNFTRAARERSLDAQGPRDDHVNSLTRAFNGLMRQADTRKPVRYTGRIKTSPADVISWSGCKDSQTSADTYEAGKATGAMSYAFMKTLKENPNQSYQELLTNIRRILKHQFSQKPQLSSSHPIDTRVKFIL
ncbi:hypothetical protein M0805_003504 [Coniferiporia weirii]|nr:hypothetical protein M0805_003504 [Coniferiporia weirii]